jgi:hypothetical protein
VVAALQKKRGNDLARGVDSYFIGVTQSGGMGIPWQWSEKKGEGERPGSPADMERSGTAIRCRALLAALYCPPEIRGHVYKPSEYC